MSCAPTIYTARYFASDVLISGDLVPVRLSVEEPQELGIELPYELEVVPALLPEPDMGDEWRPASRRYWSQLGALGVKGVSAELQTVSERYGGKPVALCGFEDLEAPNHSYRSVFVKWWHEQASPDEESIKEITEDGRELRFKDFNKVAKKVSTPKKQDKRWSSNEPVLTWPITNDELRAWTHSRYWQFARTLWKNPHSYTHAGWGTPENFVLVVLHIREHGRREWFAGEEYVVYDLDDAFYWSMGAPASTSCILNSKFHDQEKQRQQAIEAVGKDPFGEEGSIPQEASSSNPSGYISAPAQPRLGDEAK